MVVRNTLARGRRGGFVAAAGAATANGVQAAVAGAGVAVLVARWPQALTGLRLAGAGYLLWLGLVSASKVMAARTRPTAKRHEGRAGKSYRQGLTVNLLHPGVTTFYVAVLPAFIPPSAPRGYFAFLAAAHIVIAFGCHAAWALAFDRLRSVVERPAVARSLELATAVVLIALGVKVLLD